jgi:hypothetical protein
MISIASLRNRLAAAPSPSSSVRSKYSQAIWKDSSSSWDGMVISGKRTRTARVPRHRRFATRVRLSSANGSEQKITSPKTCVSDVSMSSATANCGSPQSRPKTSCLKAICRASSSYPRQRWRPGPAEVVIGAGVRRDSVRVSRTSTVRSRTISSLSSSPAISPRSAAGAW